MDWKELLCTYKKKTNVYDVIWAQNINKDTNVTYGDLFLNNEIEHSLYNFQYSNSDLCLELFKKHLKETIRIIKLKCNLLLPAYEHLLYSIHYFNLLDAKKTFSTEQRKKCILEIRNTSKLIAKQYCKE